MRLIFSVLGLLLALSTQALAQSTPVKFLSAASNNSTLVFKTQAGRAGVRLKAGLVANTTATVYYVKLYDKATAPTCGTDVPKWTIPVPASTSGNGFSLQLGDGMEFVLGIGFCIVAGIADNDNTSAAAGVVVNLGISLK